eukprot:6173365-Pleurochrysis_carterae.AAC.2
MDRNGSREGPQCAVSAKLPQPSRGRRSGGGSLTPRQACPHAESPLFGDRQQRHRAPDLRRVPPRASVHHCASSTSVLLPLKLIMQCVRDVSQ